MRLDVIIPTYNRAQPLSRAIRSLFAADVPSGLSVAVTIVDNNSTDQTRDMVLGLQKEYGDRLHYVTEDVQSGGAARNRGILETDGDLIAMVDDDEEVESNWYHAIYSVFSQRSDIGFIGGPYLPAQKWEMPRWWPGSSYRGVLGWMENGSSEYLFGEGEGILLGGNCAFRREVFGRVGLYNVHFGHSKRRLLCLEDQEMTDRLLAARERGLYVPGMIIYHHTPIERLTKSYHRRWSFWCGVSLGIRERLQPSPVARVGRIPRHTIRKGIASMGGLLATFANPRNRSEAFRHQLDVLKFSGMVVGLYFWKIETPTPQQSRSGVHDRHLERVAR